MRDAPASQHTDDAAGVSGDRASRELLERLRAATLGEYDIHSELGRGGMATVYLAHEISLDRKVAIKVMSPAMVHGTGMVERFKREARTAANLSHPNIIPIYSVREANGLLFCVIKLVEGTPLDAIMKQLGQLPVPMVQGILAQVGGALGYAHRHGVVHRDIKPGNILIDDEGWAVVTDFGIAKVVENEGLTVTGMAVGTPAYMSPEQATADVVTGAADQYSLGVVAYEMLAGRPPFTGASMMAIMYSHFHDEPASIRLLRPDCPDQLLDAVMRMLRKAPADRFPSMEEAVAAAGARPMDHDDPNRSQLISLARTGLTHRIVSQAKTPRSPIPKAAGGPAAASARVARNPLLVAAMATGLLAAGFLIAKLAGSAAAPPTGTGSQPDPASSIAAETMTTPAATPPATSQPARDSVGQARTNGGDAPVTRRLASPPTAPVQKASSGEATTPGRVDPPPAQRPDSSGTDLLQKPESIVRVPQVAAPPVASASAPPPVQPPITRVAPTASEQVTSAIQSYARALAASDLALARRLYPGMPNDQREGLEALWREGGTMTPAWTISEIAVDGDVATARVRGSNAVTTRRGQASTVPVSLRARLERRNGEWRLVALVN